MKKRILACFMAVCMLVCLSITASAADVTYTDLAGYDWAEEAIYRWTEAGIVEGNGDNTFNPAGLLKRSEAAKIFANLLKLTEKSDKVFVDVPGTEWYADYVALVNKAEIMKGMSDTTFEPGTAVSREMVFTMVCRALGIEGQETLNGTFEDAAQVSEWAKKSVNALVNLGYVNGRTATTLAPQENMTRAEMMALLNKVIAAYVTESCVVTLDSAAEGVVLVVAEGAEVDMSGVEGAAKVVATVGKVSVVNAPVGTTVTSANGATGVTANGTEVKADDSETITEPVVTPDPVDPTPDEPEEPEEPEEPKAPIIVHVHSYKNWTADGEGNHVGTCECGETKSEPCDYSDWKSDDAGNHYKVCSVCDDKVEEACDMEGTEATCVADGKKVCSVCEYTVVTKATGHGECDCDMEDAMKFGISVSSKETTVSATVYDDYSAVLVIPADGVVDASEVTVTAEMQNVGSLGVDGKKSHSLTVSTGIEGKENVSLKQHLGKVIGFTGGAVNVDIEGETFTYVLEGDGKGTITATPYESAEEGAEVAVQAARDAWKALTEGNIVTDTDKETDDSYIVIANGSYIAVGGEILCFEEDYEDDLRLDNFNELGDLKEEIKKAVKVEDAETDSDMVIFVKAGTELAISSSSAVLENDCTITLEGIDNESNNMTGILSKIRTAGNSTTTEMVKELIGLINQVVGGVQGRVIDVTVQF